MQNVFKAKVFGAAQAVTSDSRALVNSNPAFAGAHFEHQPQSSPLTAFLFLGSHARIPRWCSKTAPRETLQKTGKKQPPSDSGSNKVLLSWGDLGWFFPGGSGGALNQLLSCP